MNRETFATARTPLLIGALIGAILGALIALALTPGESRYVASANVAILPASDAPTSESSGFWEVLTSGQVSKTAAIVYQDPDRWLPSAAQAAGVPMSDLSLTAAAIPDTTMVTVTVTGPTAQAAETALEDVLRTSDPQVSRVTAPFTLDVLGPQEGTATQSSQTSTWQVLVIGIIGGGIVGAGAGLLISRRRTRRNGQTRRHSAHQVTETSEPERDADLPSQSSQLPATSEGSEAGAEPSNSTS